MRSLLTFCRFLVFPLLLSSSQKTWAASNVTVTPSSVPADYRGTIAVEATVGSGNRIVLSIAPDFNGNGTIDGMDRNLWVYLFRDGAPNPLDHPGRVVDRDGSQNGHIRAVIPFFDAPHVAGNFVVTVLDETSAAAASFSVTVPPTWGQKVTGTVAKAMAPHVGMVSALLPVGESEIQFMALTDQNGDFEVSVPIAGQYMVAAFYLDLLSDFEAGSAALVDVATGETQAAPYPLLLFDGEYTVSGQVTRGIGPQPGVPLLFILLQTDGEGGSEYIAPTVTDASGNFSFPAKAGTVWIEGQLQNPRGLVVQPQEVVVPDADVSGVTVSASGIEGIISGTVTNDDPAKDLHIGLGMFAGRGSESLEIWDAYTDSNGDYWIGVTGGDWWVGVDTVLLDLNGYVVRSPGYRFVYVAYGQTVESVDFTIGEAAGFASFHTREGSVSGPPVPNVGIVVRTGPSWDQYVSTDESGDTSVALDEGVYSAHVVNESIRGRGYVQPEPQDFTIVSGGDVSVTFVLEPGSATATVRLLDKYANPVGDGEISLGRREGDTYLYAGGGLTDQQGEIAFPIRAGSYMAFLSNYPGYPDSFLPYSVMFDAADGENVNVDLYLLPREATLNVHVQDSLGSPLAVRVTISDETHGTDIFVTWTDASGNSSMLVPAMPLGVRVDPSTVPGHLLPPDPQYVDPQFGSTENLTFTLEPAVPPLEADINRDGVVDKYDLLILMNQWGQSLGP